MILTYCFVLAGLAGLAGYTVARKPTAGRLCGSGLLVAVAAALVAVLMARFFHAARLLAIGWFVHLPIFVLVGALLARRAGGPFRFAAALGAALLVGVGCYAHYIEPYWLEVEQVTIYTAKLGRPLRILLIADFQTDVFGDYERAALQQAAHLQPDIIAFAGDYLQVSDVGQWNELRDEMRRYMRQIGFSAPDGVFAVGGNTDRYRWPEIFQGLPVHCFTQTSTWDGPDFQLTGLAVNDSFALRTPLPPTNKFHIVLGHAPDFALRERHADLLLAGHTHGGQVRLPLLGPLVTFSDVPRAWAAGVTNIGHNAGADRFLVVSRGVGMERGEAPRIRFLCRPQLVVIDVQPLKDVPPLRSHRP